MNERELQALLDRQAITEILYLYCRACDRGDETLLRSLFHPDSTHRHGGFEGLSQDFAGFAMKIIGRSKVTKHLLTNVSIEFEGAGASARAGANARGSTSANAGKGNGGGKGNSSAVDVACAESHYSAYHRAANRETGFDEDQFSGGRYLDRFERRDGQWKIAARIGLIDYEKFQAPAERAAAQLPPEARSRSFGEDALYELLGLERSRRLP